MNTEQQQDVSSMPPDKQMEAMGLALPPETATTEEGRQEDLPSMPPAQQMEAMGLTPPPETAAGDEGRQEEPRPEASASRLEPEVEAYQASRAAGEAPNNAGT